MSEHGLPEEEGEELEFERVERKIDKAKRRAAGLGEKPESPYDQAYFRNKR